MTRPTRWYLLGGFFLAAGLGGAHYVRNQGHGDYQFSTVERGDLQSVITATGTSNAVVTVQVGSQVSGNIKALYADFNTKVKKGQVIALIDQEIFQARVNQYRANLDSARSAVVSARAQLLKVAADIAGAQANLKNELANLAKAKVTVLDGKNKLDRRVLLVKEGLASREDLDSAQDVAATQHSSAEAQVRQVEASVQQAQVDLEHTVIRAPVDGTVIARRMDVGQTVAASFQAPTIFEIAQDLTRMQVDASINEADIGRVQVGQPATFTVANSDLKLLPGMTANVKILTEQAKGVLKIPNLALRFRPPDAAGAPAKAAFSGPHKGDSSRALTESEARRSLAVLVPEPGTGLAGKLKTARRGVGVYHLAVAGKAAHSGVDFSAGASAILELPRQIGKIAEFTNLKRGLTVNPGVISGGTRSNVVAAEAGAEIDMRVVRLKDAAGLGRKFRALKPFDKRCSLTVSGGLNRPPMERTAGVVRLFRAARALARDLGVELEESMTGGGSDGNFTAALGVATLDGLGGVGEGAHAANESILVDRIADRTALIAKLLGGI